MNKSISFPTRLKRAYYLARSNGCLNFEITNNCQLRCAHCYFFRKNIKQKELSSEEIIAVAKDFRKKGGLYAWITGGEPTIRMDEVEAILKIIPNVRIVTNGFKQVPTKYDVTIYFSVDGGKEHNTSVRGKNTWKLLSKHYANDKRVMTVMTINSKNYKSMGEFVELSKMARILGCVFSVHTSSRLVKNDPLALSEEQKTELMNIFKKLRKEHGNFIKMSVPWMKTLLVGVKYDRCVWRKSKVMRFDGTYKFCPMFETAEEADCEHCGCVSAGVLVNRISNMPFLLYFA